MRLKLFAVALVLSGCQSFHTMSAEEQQAFINGKGRDCAAKGREPGTSSDLTCVHARVRERSSSSRPQACGYFAAGSNEIGCVSLQRVGKVVLKRVGA